MKRVLLVAAGVAAVLFLGFAVGRWAGPHKEESRTASRRILYYVDPMHPAYRSNKPGIAPDCGMALEPVYEGDSAAPALNLQPGAVALSPERQQLIGIRVATATRSAGTRMVRTTGRVVPDDNRLFKLLAGFDGWVDSLYDNPPGTMVKKGQPLAKLFSPEIRQAETNYLGFINGVERLRSGLAQGDANMKSIDDTARINEEQLRLLGMGEEQMKQLAKSHRPVSTLDLVAPADGIVLLRNVSPSQRYEKGAELFRIADLSKVWIVADVHGDEGEFRQGTRVKVSLPGNAKKVEATVSSAMPLFDEAARTLKLRLEANNPGFQLRPDMFVEVEFETRVPAGLSIPAEAVLDSGLRKIVYVETSQGAFEPRQVEISGTVGDRVTIASGIAEGDRIVVSGNFLLDSESRMRSASQPSSAAKPAMDPVMPHAGASSMAPMQPAAMQSKDRKTALAVDAIDPVCGMPLKAGEQAFVHIYKGKTFALCSDACLKKFLADPGKYAVEKAANSPMTEDRAAPHHD